MTLLIMLNPFAPHMTEEIWEQQGFGGMLNQQKWVGFDPEKCARKQRWRLLFSWPEKSKPGYIWQRTAVKKRCWPQQKQNPRSPH